MSCRGNISEMEDMLMVRPPYVKTAQRDTVAGWQYSFLYCIWMVCTDPQMGKLCVAFNTANWYFNSMQAQALHKLEILDVPWYCGQPAQLKCLQKGKLLKLLDRAKLRFSSQRQMSQLYQTRKLLYICYVCLPIFQHPCKLLTAEPRICDVKTCRTWYCVSRLDT